jgi:hypothetical protein
MVGQAKRNGTGRGTSTISARPAARTGEYVALSASADGNTLYYRDAEGSIVSVSRNGAAAPWSAPVLLTVVQAGKAGPVRDCLHSFRAGGTAEDRRYYYVDTAHRPRVIFPKDGVLQSDYLSYNTYVAGPMRQVPAGADPDAAHLVFRGYDGSIRRIYWDPKCSNEHVQCGTHVK